MIDLGRYTVNEVEERTKVPAGTLRQWERRYGFPMPERSGSGYRLYSNADLASIEAMKLHIASGVPASRAAELVSREVRGADQARSIDDLRGQFVEALVALDDDRAEAVLGEAYGLYPLDEVISRLLHDAMVDIGQRWHDGGIPTTTEHYASGFVGGRLRMLMSIAGTSHGATSVMVACAPGEHHELGALMVAVLLRRAGYRVYFTGANTPIGDLGAMAASVQPSALLISASSRASVERLRGQQDELQSIAPLLIFGGRAFDADPAAAGRLGGLYLAENARDAVLQFELLYRDWLLNES